jgi:hypothetical protein
MAYDLFFQTETDADWSMHLPGSPQKAKPLPLDFTTTERKVLKLLEPSTATFAVNLVGWARNQGIPARLSHTAIYSPKDTEDAYEHGRSQIQPGKLDWHNVGRAIHVVIYKPDGVTLDTAAYPQLGAYARSQGGEWLGDKPIRTKFGTIIYDTVHFEYHPGIKIADYRKSELAMREFAQAQKRARRYA